MSRPVVARDQESLINSFSFVYSLPSHFAEVTEVNRERLEGLTRELGSDSEDLGVDFQDKLYQVKRVIFNGLLESINSEVTRRVRPKEGENEQDLILKKGTFQKTLLGSLFLDDDNSTKIIKDIDQFIHDITREFKHEGRILSSIGQAFPEQSVEVISIASNDQQTANSDSAHIVKARIDGVEKNLYVKSCAEELGIAVHADHKIDPRELFLYKSLEYLGLGPKTHFIVRDVTASYRGSVARGSYIITEEVEGIRIDNETNRPYFEAFMRSSNREDAIELSRASLVADLLSLTDIFESNTRNYGLVSREDGNRIIFVDHLPGSNGIFSCINHNETELGSFSPRQRIGERFGLARAKDSGLKGVPSYLGDEAGVRSWAKRSLAADVIGSVFGGSGDRLPINEALGRANADVLDLIRRNENSFTESAPELLGRYEAKIQSNIQTCQKTQYFKDATGR